MGIARIKRRYWVLLSLAVGYLVVQVHRALPQPMSAYGAHMTDQKTFEAALVREYQGRRLFHDLVVYPVEVDEGGGRTVKHFVAGRYFNGRPLKVAGRWEAKWEPYCFVAGAPFVPQTDGEALDPAQRQNLAVARAAARQAQQRPGRNADGEIDAPPATQPVTAHATVLDYLDRISREKGVTYTYAWWRHPRWQTAIWMAGSFLVIGLAWPTLVNVLAFGTLRRPPEDATGPTWAEALRGVFRRQRAAPAAPQASADDAAVREYDAALEAQLAAGAGATDPLAAIGPDLPPPGQVPPALSAAAEPVSAGDAPHEEHHYDAKQDDFYPTETKPVHHR